MLQIFLRIFDLLNQSVLEDKNWKNRFTALIWIHLKKFKYLVKIQGQHFEKYEVFESFKEKLSTWLKFREKIGNSVLPPNLEVYESSIIFGGLFMKGDFF